MQTRIAAPTTSRRGETEHMTIVPSFTSPGTSYVVKGGSCTCGAAKYGKGCVKHIAVAPALEAIRALPRPEASRDMIEERVLRLAKRVYSRPLKTETAASSFDLFLEAAGERYATNALREAARRRHEAVYERYFGEEVA